MQVTDTGRVCSLFDMKQRFSILHARPSMTAPPHHSHTLQPTPSAIQKRQHIKPTFCYVYHTALTSPPAGSTRSRQSEGEPVLQRRRQRRRWRRHQRSQLSALLYSTELQVKSGFIVDQTRLRRKVLPQHTIFADSNPTSLSATFP
jgi:hypothetical protein